MKTIAEQIADLEATRAAKSARAEEVMAKSMEEGRSTDEAEAEEFDTLSEEIKTIDEDLARLRKLEKMAAQKAAPVDGEDPKKAAESREGTSVRVRNTQKLEPGIRVARIAKCLGLAKGSWMQAELIAQRRYADDEVTVNVIKAAVAAGTTSDPTWAGALVGEESTVFADFVEFLRPQTIVGRFGSDNIPSLRRVPFRVALIGQTSGGSGYWVGEGQAKPLTKFDFARQTLEPLKVANIAVVTEEVLRDSSPSADMILRDQLVAALRERLDIDFIDPSKTASAGVSPASITNGATPIQSTGPTAEDVRCDIQALFAQFIAANNAPTMGVWIMPATIALALSLLQNPLGQSEFPGVSMAGGTLFGLPVIVSEYVPANTVVLVNASDIYLGDEGGFMVDMSREASLEMDDAPSHNSTTPTPSTLVSLWQTNSVGFRAERTINWAPRRPSAVAVLENVEWGSCASP